MKVQDLMANCRANGVSIHIGEGKVTLRGVPAAVDRAATILRPHKAELLAMFGSELPGSKEIWGEFTPYVCPSSVLPDATIELRDLIEKYGTAHRIAGSALARIRLAAMKQPASTIADSIRFFKQAIR